MVAEELVTLASAGGAALVGAVASDAWSATKSGFVRLLGRGDETRSAVVEQQLERTHTAVEAARANDDDRVHLQQQAVWASRLEDLLLEHPGASAELRALVQQIEDASGSRSAGHVVQFVTASDQAQQAVLGYGYQVNTFARPQGQENG